MEQINIVGDVLGQYKEIVHNSEIEGQGYEFIKEGSKQDVREQCDKESYDKD